MKKLDIIGRAELVDFPTLKLKSVPAKIDTGADVSSIWCSKAVVVDDCLTCIFFGPGNPFYSGKIHRFPKNEYTITRVSNSFGHREVRYKVEIPVRLNNRRIRAKFTLADRSQKLYSVLIGNSLLKGKFLVDASRKSPLHEEENKRKLKLKDEMDDFIEEIE